MAWRTKPISPRLPGLTFCVIAGRCSFPRRAVTNAIKIVRHLARLYHTRHFREHRHQLSSGVSQWTVHGTMPIAARDSAQQTQTNPLVYVKQRFRLEITHRVEKRKKKTASDSLIPN